MNKIDKHAYLVMCHNNFEILCKLLSELDDVRNDIYIHVDKKVPSYPHERLKECVINANLYFVNRLTVSWGGYSQIRAELRLLKTATETYHNYYHLLSGMDYPLKSQDYIYGFFQQNQGKEFIGFDSNKTVDYKERVRYYYFFQDRIGRNAGKIVALYYIFQQKLLFLQKKLHVDRTRKCPFKIYKGTNWFSITHDLATYLLQRTELIEKYFSHGLCTDEVFLQTIAMSSPYKENIVDNSLRYIDWERGNPYVFTNEDYEELITSDKLFARKFDEDIDSDIVNKVSEYLRISNF